MSASLADQRFDRPEDLRTVMNFNFSLVMQTNLGQLGLGEMISMELSNGRMMTCTNRFWRGLHLSQYIFNRRTCL